MRKLFLPVAACITLFVASCSKSEPADNGCIERTFIARNDPALTPSAIQTADSLFAVNNINHSNFRYYLLQKDTFNMTDPPYTFINSALIQLDQYTNGLRILNGQESYQFFNGIVQYHYGTPTKGTSLDTVPKLTLKRLRQLFSSDLRSHTGNTTPGLTDSCYKAEFGYYNLASFDTSAPEVLVKAWMVTLISTPSWPYPYGIYRDDDGKPLYYLGNIFLTDPFIVN